MKDILVIGSKDDLWSSLRNFRNEAIKRFQEKFPNIDVKEVEVTEIEFYADSTDLFVTEEEYATDFEDGDLVMSMSLNFLLNNITLEDAVNLSEHGRLTVISTSRYESKKPVEFLRVEFATDIDLEMLCPNGEENRRLAISFL